MPKRLSRSELLSTGEPELDIHRALRHAAIAQAVVANEPKTSPAPLRKRADVILECGLRLFNQVGVASISTNRISAELGISPGNMHYHFRTKGDLLQSAFHGMDVELREACARSTAVQGVAGFVDWQIAVQRILWRNRYFFGSLDVVLRTAPELRIPWLELQSALVAQLASTHQHYVDAGLMVSPKASNTVSQVAQNSLMLWMSWISWEFLALDGRTPTDQEGNQIIHRLVWHHLSFYEPYHVRSERASTALIRVLDERLLGRAVTGE